MVAPGGGGSMRGCSRGGMHGCSGGGHAWDTMRYRDTINERVVRILLECILGLNCKPISGWPHSSQNEIPCVFPVLHKFSLCYFYTKTNN